MNANGLVNANANVAHVTAPILEVLAWPGPEGPGRGKAEGAKGLSAPAKTAWVYLVIQAGGVNRPWTTHAASLGAAIGFGDRCGRNALEALKDWGLIDIPSRYKGEVKIFLNDPREVGVAKPMRTEPNADQGELAYPADVETQADAGGDEPATIPVGGADNLAFRKARLSHHRPCPPGAQSPSPINHSSNHGSWGDDLAFRKARSDEQPCLSKGKVVAPAELRPATPAETAAAAKLRADQEALAKLQRLPSSAADRPAGAPSVSEALVDGLTGAFQRFTAAIDQTPADFETKVNGIVAYIRKRVDDPQLAKSADGSPSAGGEQKLRRIAQAVVAGELTKQELDHEFHGMEIYCRKHKVGSRAALFMRIMQRVFAKRNPPIPWGDARKSDTAMSTASTTGGAT